jgi:hypothetical protein
MSEDANVRETATPGLAVKADNISFAYGKDALV